MTVTSEQKAREVHERLGIDNDKTSVLATLLSWLISLMKLTSGLGLTTNKSPLLTGLITQMDTSIVSPQSAIAWRSSLSMQLTAWKPTKC